MKLVELSITRPGLAYDEEDLNECCECGSVTNDTTCDLHISDSSKDWSEDPVCARCFLAEDADICLLCGGVWWTGVAPPYTEENSPGTVCQPCFDEKINNPRT